MGRVTERVLVAVMLLTALQSALGQTAATAENQETESSPLETDRQDQDPLVQQFTASVSQLQQQCQSHQQTLSEQMSEQMSEQISELRKESLSRQDTLSKQMSEQMSELRKESLSYREDLAKLTQRIDRLLQERSLNHQGDLAELTKRFDRLPRDLPSTAGSSNTCQSSCRSNCKDWKRFSRNGVHTIYLCHEPITVYCDQTTDNGGWTVFQRRVNASVDFYRGWEDYRKGFGDLEGNFWLGLDKLHRLTTSQIYELRVDLEKWDGTKGHAIYSGFYVDGASNYFTLHYDSFTGGNAGNSLYLHRGMAFTTKDRDNDKRNHANCAQQFHGAWWYENCYDSSLNGKYRASSTASINNGIVWRTFGGSDTYSMKFSEMKIRPM